MEAVQESQFNLFLCPPVDVLSTLNAEFNCLYLSRKCLDSPETIFVP